MWSGAANAIPAGWALCDGSSYTVNGSTFNTETIAPGRFPCMADPAAGTGGENEIGSTGGYKLHGGSGDGAANDHAAHFLYHEHEPVAGTASGTDNATNTGGPDWAPTGGGDPVKILREHPCRAATLHPKEHAASNPAPLLGEGEVDWRAVLEVVEAQGATDWLIVEHEGDAVPPLAAVERCLANLRKMVG